MKRAWIWFLVANAMLTPLLFGSALWGQRILAPLDIAATLYPQFRWVDPQAGHVPANHYIVDQFTYDLPLQHTIYAAYHRGEIPWWDPYTLSGRPLLADAHVNGTDPVRLLCYALLPFVAAYNWTLILHGVLGGLGLLVLLRRLGFAPWITLFIALAFQFSGSHTLSFGHPWIRATFVYYPWLWIAWDAWWREEKPWAVLLGNLAAAGIFYSGNLQSHAYLALFTGAFVLGCAGLRPAAWWRLTQIVAPTLVFGALLAAPMLSVEIEAFLNSRRLLESYWRPTAPLAPLLSLAAPWPWMLGTFRTFDASKLTFSNADGLGFRLFLGSVAVVLAAVAVWRRPADEPRAALRRVCLWLLAIYFIGVATPLVNFLYSRLSILGVLGVTLLAAIGLEQVAQGGPWLRRFGKAVAMLSLGLLLAAQILAFVIYPRLQPVVHDYLEKRANRFITPEMAGALRDFQLGQFPREVSVRNPETLFALVGLLSLAAVCLRSSDRHRTALLCGVMTLNLLPGILFFHRFAPNQPVEVFERLRAGGPQQQLLKSLLGGRVERLYEQESVIFFPALPPALNHYYGVRVVNGYAANQPYNFWLLPPEERLTYRRQLADYFYDHPTAGEAIGRLTTNTIPGTAVFQWTTPSNRGCAATAHGLDEVRIQIADGPAGTLLWTDTAYPGWRATLNGKPLPLRRVPPFFQELNIPAGAGELVLRYRPTWLTVSLILMFLGGAGGIAAFVVVSRAQVRRLHSTSARAR